MKPIWTIKHFDELSTHELYAMMSLRSKVFVVEQNCVYQDLDNKDQKALHLLGKFDEKIVSYARLFKSGDYFKNASIGRVVIDPEYRNRQWGNEMMKQAIEAIDFHFKETKITISAQLYLQQFYENNGFVKTSEVYLEDDIEHIEMKKEN
jgi:ElaA protein